ncbi:MAG: 2-keto-4-pentenoate hydratase [Steroidobacteraceae bacterium]
MTNTIEQAATWLRQAAETGQPCAPVRGLIGETSIVDAYAVQEINTKRALAAGRRIVGAKIGLTSKVVQAQLGVGQPDFGILFADMDIADGAEVPAGKLIQPKCEAEIAFVLGRDLNREKLTTAELINAVDYAVAAIEIVDSRIENWSIKITDTVADNASSGLFVLGTRPVKLADVDLVQCAMTMVRGSEQVSKGAGAACLGNPLNALRWLAETLAVAGRALKAGDVVLSGALGPMVAANPGDVFEARIDGLGNVRASFSR